MKQFKKNDLPRQHLLHFIAPSRIRDVSFTVGLYFLNATSQGIKIPDAKEVRKSKYIFKRNLIERMIRLKWLYAKSKKDM